MGAGRLLSSETPPRHSVPQLVRTRGPARPRNLVIGCLGVVVVLTSLALCGRAVEEIDEASPTEQTAPPAE